MTTNHATADALHQMLHPHAERLLDYLRRHIPHDLRSYIDPEDVAQDAFFHAARAASQVQLADGESSWRWIVTVARNCLITKIEAQRAAKRGGRHRQLDLAEQRHGSIVALLEDLALHLRTPSRSAARREFLLTLERSLDQLQPNYREVIRLRFLEGMSLKEAAARLQRSEDSTQKLSVRGLEALRLQLRTMSLYI